MEVLNMKKHTKIAIIEALEERFSINNKLTQRRELIEIETNYNNNLK